MKRSFCGWLSAVVTMLTCYAVVLLGAGPPGNPPPKADLKKMKEVIELLETPVTLDFQDTPAKDAVSFLINRVPRITFAWEADELPDKAVTISVQEKPLGDVLASIMDKADWSYAVRYHGDLYLYPKPKPKQAQN